jgi:hypothetical protein
MAFVELVAAPRDDVTRELFDADLAQRGYVPDFTRVFGGGRRPRRRRAQLRDAPAVDRPVS